MDGVIPLRKSFDAVGLLTRTVEDAQMMFRAFGGDAGSSEGAMEMNRVRVGIARAGFFDKLDDDVGSCVEKALKVLHSLVASVRDVKIEVGVKWTDFDVEILEYHHQMLANSPELYQRGTLARLKTCAAIPPDEFAGAQRGLAATRNDAEKIFDSVDVILTPTCLVAAPKVADLGAMSDANLRAYEVQKLLGNTAPFSLLFWPSVSVPCGFTRDGLPVGLQISAHPGADALVLHVARAYEQATAWHERTPKLAG
jgi:aspartyl-tRNA(Asn)/glutamyl-tRNA(Gln) amidotransferase subunit A